MLESSRAVASAETLEKGLGILVRQSADAMGVTRCVAYEYLRELDVIIVRATWEETSTGSHKLGETLLLSDCPTESAVLSSGLPLIGEVSDPVLAMTSRADPPAPAKRASLTVPMGSVDGPMGLLMLHDSECERRFTDDDMALATGLADLAGESIRGAQLLRRLQKLSTIDSLTGLVNHRHFHEMLEQEHARAVRNETCFCLVMLDIDGFKLLNDTYGHPCGDDALRHVASILQERTRKTDVVGRYGGDEFVLILPETDAAKAEILVKELRETFAEAPFSAPTGDRIPIHSSFGIATYPQDGQEVNELVVAADTKLYISKRSGGNVITGSGEEQGSDLDLVENFGLLEAMLTAVDSKDRYTRRHSIEVTEHSLALATALGSSDDTLRVVRAAGLFHDVGKIAIADRILRKPGRLTEAEHEVVKGHPSMGASLIRSMPDLDEIGVVVISHHERFDGTGYPEGLVGAEIPLLARVLAIADAYSAMTTDRPYRKALTHEEAIDEMTACARTQFDPELLSAFLDCLDQQSNKSKPSSGLTF